MDNSGGRRLQRAISRAGDWLKEILEAKAQESDLNFGWHVLAGIQGGGDVKLREKACAAAASMPVSGFWVGGLGYGEGLAGRGRVLAAVDAALPPAAPRFLPLGEGAPVEVLQAVLLGMDVLEVTCPTSAAAQGIALLFSCDMPQEDHAREEAEVAADLEALLPPPDKTVPEFSRVAHQLHLRAAECREDFGPISEESPVRQYSRAYLYHLLEVRELLGTMLLAQHNLDKYARLFAAVQHHVKQDTIRHFVSWFLRTQTRDAPAAPAPGPAPKRRKT